MNKMKKLLLQFTKFASVGTFCFFLDYGLMILLTEFTRLSYFAATGTSYTVATIVNYILSMLFVFRGKEGMSKVKEISIFILLSLIGLGFNQIIMWIAVETFGIYYMIAKVGATMIVTNYNFISRKIFLE